MPTISIIIPTFNRAKLIERAIISLLTQTYQDFEIIVVDDGSTDNTRDVVFSFGNQIRYMRQDNRGPSSARNAGISASRGKFVAFLDSDDYFMKPNLEIKMSFLESNPQVGWVYSDWQYVDEKGNDIDKGSLKFRYSEKVLNGNIFEELIKRRNFISPCTVVIKKSVLDDVGHFDPLIPSQEEYDLWLRTSIKYPVYYIDQVLVNVTLHPASLSKDFTKWAQGNSIIADKLKDLLPYDFKDRGKVLDKIIADKHTFLGRDFSQKGQFSKAIYAFWRSIKHLPLQRRVYWLMFVTVVRSIPAYLLPESGLEKDRT
jgi:glycosyltransferase involved in cell wall biosynthesis